MNLLNKGRFILAKRPAKHQKKPAKQIKLTIDTKAITLRRIKQSSRLVAGLLLIFY